MAHFKHLRDLYRFPGFGPGHHIRGVFGDPMAVVISLRRRRKKRFAGTAAWSVPAAATSGSDACVISPAVTDEFISRSRFGESSAPGARA